MARNVKNNRGQALVEAILVAVVLATAAALVQKAFKDNDILASMIEAPWKNLDGMIQSGVWAEADVAVQHHPNRQHRQISLVE